MSQQAILLNRETIINKARRGWRPRPFRLQHVQPPKPMQQGPESLALAAAALKEASLSAGKDILKGTSIPTLALLYLLTATPACRGKDVTPAWGINPSTECNTYPYGEIFQDIRVEYTNGAAELPGERTRVLQILGSIDYRFTEGIKKIQIEETESSTLRGRILGDTLILYKRADGEGGAFENDGWLTFVIHHEVGHHVEKKMGPQLYEDFKSLLTNVFNERYPDREIDEELIHEDFANFFARYIISGLYFKLLGEIPESDKSRYTTFNFEDLMTDIRIYNWLKRELFCENEYNTNQTDWAEMRTSEIYFQKGSDHRLAQEYDKAVEAFNNAIAHNYAESDYARLTIAYIYDFQLLDKAAALLEYQKLVDQYPQSSYVPDSLFGIGNIYRSQDRYAESIPILLRLINNYLEFTYYEFALYYLGDSYFRENQCLDAIYYLQRLINEYPSSAFVSAAQNKINQCNTP